MWPGVTGDAVIESSYKDVDVSDVGGLLDIGTQSSNVTVDGVAKACDIRVVLQDHFGHPGPAAR